MVDAAVWHWAIAPFLLVETIFWLVSGTFAVLDHTLSHTQLAQSKLQSHRATDSQPSYSGAALRSLRNHLCGSLPTMILFSYLYRWRRCESDPFALPSLAQALYQVTVIVLVEEFLFYYLHRLYHSGRFYQYIHSHHHRWKAPVSWASTDCHYVEHLSLNLLPVMLGPLVAQAHYCVWFAWITVATINTCLTHSGYRWPVLGALNHDSHHEYNKCCFGTLKLLDWLHGTRREDILEHIE